MATRASRAANAPVVNTIPKSHHLGRRPIWNKDTRSSAGVNIRTLEWVCLGFDNIAGGSRGTGARWPLCIGCGTALVHDPVNASANVVGYIQRPVRSNRK